MSVSKWAYTPEKCDGSYCYGDCSFCPKAYEDEREDNEMIELESCPFCGSEAELVGNETGITSDENSGYWFVLCSKCGANVYGSKDKATAITRWNKRVDERKHRKGNDEDESTVCKQA